MERNFNQPINRAQTGCLKYDGRALFDMGEDRLPMWIADMDLPTVPAVVHSILARAEHPIYGYNYPADSYYNSVIHWMRERHGMQITRPEIIPFPGIIPAISLILTDLLEKGDCLLVQPPVYGPFEKAALLNGLQVAHNRLLCRQGRYEMDFADFEDQIRRHKVKAFVLCNPHNPVGRVWTREELTRIAEICQRYDLLILSDEIHADLVFAPAKHLSISQLSEDAAQRTIVCTAPTKTFNMAGLKVSNILIKNPALRAKFQHACERLDLVSLNTFAYPACEAAYSEGQPWLEALLLHLRENFRQLDRFIKTELPSLTFHLPEATYLAWINCSSVAGTLQELKHSMVNSGNLWVEYGDEFGADAESKFIRLNLAVPNETLQKALQGLKDAVHKQNGF